MTTGSVNDASASACRIVIIAKAPIPGYCKTRLIPALGAQGAAALASRLLLRTVQTALAADVGPVELCAAPSRHEAAWAALDLPAALDWSEQTQGDLGARMAAAAQRTLARGEQVLLIGTDCPELDGAYLRRAAAALRAHDAALAPTADGGYALLGLRRFHTSLFDSMPWSTQTVAGETLRRLAKIPWSVKTLPLLHDIDEPADLPWLPDELKILTQEAMRHAS